MDGTFRLLSAETALRAEKPRWRPERQAKVTQPVTISFDSVRNTDRAPDGQISVLLGRNGQGKSRSLSAVAASFQLLQAYGRSRPKEYFPLRRLTYEANGRHHEVLSPFGKIPELLIDGVERPLSEAILPSKVIALSMTPFDKFPIGSEASQAGSIDPSQEGIYSYLGMRDRMGRASVSVLLFRAVENLFSRHDRRERDRIVKVFDLVGYKPSVDIVFRLDSVAGLREIDLNNRLLESNSSNTMSRFRLSRLKESSESQFQLVRDAARMALEAAAGGFVKISLNVESPSPEAINIFSQLQLLRQSRLARLFAVEAEKANGDVIDLKQASSGELSIAISFMSLASYLQDFSLVLIDEPEANLHPEWQAKYIELLTATFSGFYGCHYVLATHSPLILSDAPPSTTVCSVSDDVPTDGRETSGRSVDYLLVKAFQTASGANSYVQDEVIKALRLAADGLTNQAEFQLTVSQLKEMKPLIHDNPGIIELISNLEVICQRARKSG